MLSCRWLVDDLGCSEVLTALLRSPLNADDRAWSLSSNHGLSVGTILLGNRQLTTSTFERRLRLVNMHLRLVLSLVDDLDSIYFVAALPHFPDMSDFAS